MNPALSIIIATQNCIEDLGCCLDSVFDQNFSDFEVLVVDGASTDGTVALIKSHEKRLAWWKSEPDSGIYDAWNKAAHHANGEWLLFIGADDTFIDADSLGLAAASLVTRTTEQTDLAYSKVQVTSKLGELIDVWGKPPEDILWQLRHGMPYHLCHSAMFHRRAAVESIGGFDASRRVAGDYDLIIRLAIDNPGAIAFFPDITLLKKGADGISKSGAHIGIWETMLARRKRGFRGLTIPWFLIWSRAVVRHWIRKVLSIVGQQ